MCCRHTLNEKISHSSLAEAANLLLMDYQTDQELTVFSVPDGEPFLEDGVQPSSSSTRPFSQASHSADQNPSST